MPNGHVFAYINSSPTNTRCLLLFLPFSLHYDKWRLHLQQQSCKTAAPHTAPLWASLLIHGWLPFFLPSLQILSFGEEIPRLGFNAIFITLICELTPSKQGKKSQKPRWLLKETIIQDRVNRRNNLVWEDRHTLNFTAFMLNTAVVKIRREETCFFKAQPACLLLCFRNTSLVLLFSTVEIIACIVWVLPFCKDFFFLS